MHISLKIFLLFIVFYTSNLSATLDVVVLKNTNDVIPINILEFEGNGNLHSVAQTIANNLNRSGYFAAKKIKNNDKVDFSNIDYAKWRAKKIDYLALGKITPINDNFVQISFYLYSIYDNNSVVAYKYSAKKDSLSRVGHKISDIIYKAILGETGAFDTYLTYILVDKDKNNNNKYTIEIAQSDGSNQQQLISSSEPLMSPVWSPDNTKIAFVSFENGTSDIFIKYPFVRRNILKLPRFDGIASAPSWHPSGNKLALTLSKNGNKDIYIYDLESGELERITNHKAIDTEASFSPDGNKLSFTSNRSGRAHIYIKDLISNDIERITHNGNYNVASNFSADGKYLTMLNASNNKYHIALLELANKQWTLMTKNNLDESPYFSPNSGMIVYSSNYNNKGILAVLSIDGLRSHHLKSRDGEVRDANWSNYLRK